MKVKMKRIMGLFLALAVFMGCLSLNPIASYAEENTFNINAGSVNITKSGNYTINGTGRATPNTISVTGSNITAKITLNNVNIDVSNQSYNAAFRAKSYGQSNVHLTIILQGTNLLKSGGERAGLTWNNSDNSSMLEIEGDGSLTATGGKNAAGIGSNWSHNGGTRNIKITGGTVIATGGDGAAGIGGDRGNSAENIKITGGTVTAIGGWDAAGIGGGGSYSGKNITIAGGTVTAIGGWDAAGIGGGRQGGSGENITITGGTVIATGMRYGAGIGGGAWGSGKGLTITGGTVTATGGYAAAGIGGGSADIKITGGSVKVSGFGAIPTDGKGNNVYLAKLENQDGVNTVDSGTGNAKTFTRAGNHPGGDTAFYLYLTGQDHDLVTSKGKYKAKWNSTTNAFTVNPKVFDKDHVTAMAVIQQPTKLIYKDGEPLDLTGLKVKLTDNQTLTQEVEFKDFGQYSITATPENGAELKLTDGGNPVKLTRGNLTATTNDLKVAKFNPTSMSVEHQPNKLSYTEGENLNLDGLTVKLSDGHVTRVVEPKDFEANGIKATPENGTKLALTDGGNPVTLTKKDLADAVTLNLTVEKFKPTSMSVTSQPTKLKYTEGETLDLTGLVVTLKDDAKGVTKDVTPAEFEANGITATPENGKKLELTDGKPVTLTRGRLTAETSALKVKARVFDPSSGSGSGMNDDAPTTVDKGELNIQIDSAESDYKPGYAGDGTGAAVKQAADRLGDALAQAKRVAANPNATQAQVDSATRRLADARKALTDARKAQPKKHICVIPKTGESASFEGLLAALGFSIAGLAILRKKKMMEENK